MVSRVSTISLVMGDPMVRRWMNRQSKHYQKLITHVFPRWFSWVRENYGDLFGETPGAFIRYQKENRDYEILDTLQLWVTEELKGLSLNTKSRYYAVVRSFFMHSRCELPRDRAFKIKGDRAPIVGTLTAEEIARVIEVSKPMYKAVFSMMVGCGLGYGEIEYFSVNGWRDLQRQLDERRSVIRVNLPGRKLLKNKKPYYVLVAGDALRYLKEYLKVRPKVEGGIFINSHYKTGLRHDTVAQYWLRQLRSLNILGYGSGGDPATTRYGKNLHEMRDVFRTRFHKSGADALVAEFMMGHTVDRLGYNKAMNDEDYVRREYLKALSWLNVVSEDPTKIAVSEVDDLRLKVANQAEDIEMLKEALTVRSRARRRLLDGGVPPHPDVPDDVDR